MFLAGEVEIYLVSFFCAVELYCCSVILSLVARTNNGNTQVKAQEDPTGFPQNKNRKKKKEAQEEMPQYNTHQKENALIEQINTNFYFK